MLQLAEVTLGRHGDERPSARFAAGETVRARLKMRGLAGDRAGLAALRVGLALRDPSGAQQLVGPEQEVAPAGRAPPPAGKALVIDAPLELPMALAPGSYRLEVTVRGPGQAATSRVDLEVAGEPPPEGDGFGLARLRLAAGAKLIPGASTALSGWIVAPGGRPVERGSEVEVSGVARLIDPSNVERARGPVTLVHATLGRAPGAAPFVVQLRAPSAARQGRWTVLLEARDVATGATARATTPLVIGPRPRGPAIAGLRLLGAGGLPRGTFLSGETLLLGADVAGAAPITVDVGVEGPDGGAYLARPGAATIDAAALAAGPAALGLPLRPPEFAPAGRYLVRVRLRDGRGIEVAEELPFSLDAREPPIPAALAAEELVVRDEAHAPPRAGAKLRPGEEVWLELRVAGFEARPDRGGYLARLRATASLRDGRGALVGEPQVIEAREARAGYAPRRLRLGGGFRVPPGTLRGTYALAVEAEDLLSRRVSALYRRVIVQAP